jgi:plastocyanin
MIRNKMFRGTPSIRRRTLTLAVTSILVLGVSGCGDDKKADTAVGSEGSAVAASDPAAPGTPETEATDTQAPANDSTSASPAGGAALVSTEATSANTILLSASGFSPTTLSVAVGDTVTFKADGKGVFAVLVGDLPGATVTGGLVESFSFSKPGTYSVTEEISGNSATITVG